MKNSEQIAKIMDNTIHGLLIKNVKLLCEKIVSDPQFSKLYTHDKENYILSKLRHDFTDCYRNLMDSIDDDFSNCELNDFKNLCYRGMKITSQLIRIDHAIKKFDYRRRLTVWEKSEHIFNKVNDILEILGCQLSKQEYTILMNARTVRSFDGNKITNSILETNKIVNSPRKDFFIYQGCRINPPVLHDGSPYGRNEC